MRTSFNRNEFTKDEPEVNGFEVKNREEVVVEPHGNEEKVESILDEELETVGGKDIPTFQEAYNHINLSLGYDEDPEKEVVKVKKEKGKGKGGKVFLVILLVLLAVAAGLFCVKKFVLDPKAAFEAHRLAYENVETFETIEIGKRYLKTQDTHVDLIMPQVKEDYEFYKNGMDVIEFESEDAKKEFETTLEVLGVYGSIYDEYGEKLRNMNAFLLTGDNIYSEEGKAEFEKLYKETFEPAGKVILNYLEEHPDLDKKTADWLTEEGNAAFGSMNVWAFYNKCYDLFQELREPLECWSTNYHSVVRDLKEVGKSYKDSANDLENEPAREFIKTLAEARVADFALWEKYVNIGTEIRKEPIEKSKYLETDYNEDAAFNQSYLKEWYEKAEALREKHNFGDYTSPHSLENYVYRVMTWEDYCKEYNFEPVFIQDPTNSSDAWENGDRDPGDIGYGIP